MTPEAVCQAQAHPGVARLPTAVRALYAALLGAADRFGVVPDGRAFALDVLRRFDAASALGSAIERLEKIRALDRVPFDVVTDAGWAIDHEWIVYTPSQRRESDRLEGVFE